MWLKAQNGTFYNLEWFDKIHVTQTAMTEETTTETTTTASEETEARFVVRGERRPAGVNDKGVLYGQRGGASVVLYECSTEEDLNAALARIQAGMAKATFIDLAAEPAKWEAN